MGASHFSTVHFQILYVKSGITKIFKSSVEVFTKTLKKKKDTFLFLLSVPITIVLDTID